MVQAWPLDWRYPGSITPRMGRAFTKMHGLGNDFVVVDGRRRTLALASDDVRAIADRRTGVGCDQLIVIERSGAADAFMRVYNADGGQVGACGNGGRCVAALLMAEDGAGSVSLETVAGTLHAEAVAGGMVRVNLGPARLGWRDIPLAREADTLHLALPLGDAVAVNVGNPHAVFFVDDAEAVDLARHGPTIENDSLFPERANVSVAQVLGPEAIRLRVWERGVGLTWACGTAACATVVAGVRRGLCGRAARVRLDGGALDVEWREDGHVAMTGPAATSFEGTLDPALYEDAPVTEARGAA